MNDRKTDGGKGDRIPGANQSAYEAGYAGIQWGDGVDGKQDEPVVVMLSPKGVVVFGKRSIEINGELVEEK